MDTQETADTVNKAKLWLDIEYAPDIAEQFRKGKPYLVVDFQKLMMYDVPLAEKLLDDFPETYACFVMALKQFNDMGDAERAVRFQNLPNTCQINPSDIRDKDVGKFLFCEGNIVKRSELIFILKRAIFECASCGTIIPVLQFNNKYTPPIKCGCGASGHKCRLIERKFSHQLRLVLEEDREIIADQVKPKQKTVILNGDLTNKKLYRSLQPGKKIKVNGHLEYKALDKEEKGLEFDTQMTANYIHVIDKSWGSVNITPSEEVKILDTSRSPTLIQDLCQSLAPGVYGLETIKKAMLLQLVGGKHIYDVKGELDDRGTIHIALVGPPGGGKTYLASKIMKFSPIHRLTGGRGVSGVGLMGSVSQDKEMGTWVVEIGAVPLCDQGLCVIDEADKIDPTDINALNNAMVDLKINIDKASIHTTLQSDTSIICCANPPGRVFNDYEKKFEQVGLPKDFQDRFDLIFAVPNYEKEEEQKKIISTVTKRHMHHVDVAPKYDFDFVQKYIAFARRYKPVLNVEVEEYLKKRIIELMNSKSDKMSSKISNRLVGDVLRISYAVAKVYLKQEVNIPDVEEAIRIKVESFKSLELIDETGHISYETLEGIEEKSKSQKAAMIKQKILEIYGKYHAPIEEEALIRDLETENIDRVTYDEIIERLMRQGEMYRPKSHLIMPIL